MNKKILLAVALLMGSSLASYIAACPTCVARIERNQPPFFTPEFDDYIRDLEKRIKTERELPADKETAQTSASFKDAWEQS